jgi:UDP:flavonoid glycosyltransferase YjiC (YdhE family)
MTARRFLLCSTPAQGHAAPMMTIARRLVGDGHEVVFLTTARPRHAAGCAE